MLSAMARKITAEELEEDGDGSCGWDVALREEGHECYYWL
jgi:hypothetical protein